MMQNGNRIPLPQAGGTGRHSPRSAALLIDFDNVTMNVRGELGKEIKSLLNSDVLRGKVAVRRAYADWRRYPSSVVPLTEASIDLIYAPAYGTSKKNATDLRMAVDAIELAFMRQEIDTFILLTGDSDFSSCVMKLKEYGKYVIGVGMRESASDLLIQNCDEYYSYHALSGLTRADDDTGVREDPWALVTQAVQHMIKNGDVMRVDRLKQVMLELDSGFNEKDIGYSKFSKFISEAQSRGLLRLRRDDNGAWEVLPPPERSAESEEDEEERVERERERSRGGRGRSRFRDRDRGRDRDRDRERRPREEERPAAAEEPKAEEPRREAERPAAEAREEKPAETREEKRPETREETREDTRAAMPAAAVDPLRNAYSLLQHTLAQMVRRPGDMARDGDVKRKMLDAQPNFDEGPLGFSKFSRFLRQAHEDGVVDVRRQDEGGYEVTLPAGGARLPAPTDIPAAAEGKAPSTERPQPGEGPAEETRAEREAPAPRGRRGRGPRGAAPEGPPPILPGQVVATPAEERPAAEAQAPAEEPAAEPVAFTPAQALQERLDGELVGHREPAVASARLDDPMSVANRGSSRSAGSVGVRGRRSSRGRGAAPEGPPPILPGQAIATGRPVEQPAAEAPREEPAAAPTPAFSAEALGLSTAREDVLQHLSSYKGVGKKTAESLVDAYGDDVYQTLEENPDAVRALLGRRAGALLDQWAADRDERRAAAQPAAEEAPSGDVAAVAEAVVGDTDPTLVPEVVTGEAVEEKPARGRTRGRRGGRGRGKAPASEERGEEGVSPAEMTPEQAPVDTAAEQAEAVVGDTDPSLMGEAVVADEKPARGRSRGRRGRGRGAASGSAESTEAGQAPPEAAAEAPAEEKKPARGRGRRGAKAEAAPEPQAEPAAEEKPARGRSRGRRGGAAKKAEAPAADAQPEAPAEEKKPARGRGRGRGAATAEAEAAAPAPPAEAEGGEGGEAKPRSRSRRGGRGRGGRGRAGGNEA